MTRRAPLAIRHVVPWWVRVLPTWVRQLVALPEEHRAGADYVSSYGVSPPYSMEASMAAFGALPWVYACVNAIAEDIARLPILLMQGEDEDAQEIRSHPALDLLRKPSRRVRSLGFHRQRVADRLLAGNAYTVILGPGTRPVSMLRLHPERVEIVPSPDGQIEAYRHTPDGRRYEWEQVIHVAGISYESGPRGLYGQGAIRALHAALEAEFASWRRQRDEQQAGRPSAIASPAGATDLEAAAIRWSDEQLTQITDRMDAMMRDRSGGVMVVNGGVKLDTLSWAPSSMDHEGLEERVKRVTLAAFGVPATRLVDPSANFATASVEMRTYWENTILPLAAELDEADTAIAQRWGDDLWVTRSFRGIAALDASRTERQQRVDRWTLMGIPLAQALEAEGFSDIEAPEDEPIHEEPEPAPEGRAGWAAWAKSEGDPLMRQRRAVRVLRGRLEPLLERSISRYFRAARVRYASRAADVLGERERIIADADLARILDSAAEREALRRVFGDDVLRAMVGAYEMAIGLMRGWEPSREIDLTLRARELVGLMSPRVEAYTAERITAVVTEAIESGGTVREMQAAIMRDEAFSAERALRVSRTETTHAIESATEPVYQSAVEEGIEFRLAWLAQIDDATRDTHADMDGQTVLPGEDFRAPSGETAPYPGGFGVAALDINCRCTRAPVMED